jgi:hypothetical protein
MLLTIGCSCCRLWLEKQNPGSKNLWEKISVEYQRTDPPSGRGTHEIELLARRSGKTGIV